MDTRAFYMPQQNKSQRYAATPSFMYYSYNHRAAMKAKNSVPVVSFGN